MRLFVTGGSSPLGERTLPLLVGAGHSLECLARSDEAAARVEAAGGTAVRGDLQDSSWHERGRSADGFVHMAGIRLAPSVLPGLGQDCALVAVSSASAANPAHPLAAAVEEHERFLLQRRPDGVVLRPTMIYGSARDRNLRSLARLVARLPVVPRVVGGGLIQPVFVDDVAAAIVGALDDRAPPGILEAGGADVVALDTLLELLAVGMHKRRVSVPVPLGVVSNAIRRMGVGHRSRALHAVEMLCHDRLVDRLGEIGRASCRERVSDIV
jgi:uncharacterized protein YbjT (DUF2867 family)